MNELATQKFCNMSIVRMCLVKKELILLLNISKNFYLVLNEI